MKIQLFLSRLLLSTVLASIPLQSALAGSGSEIEDHMERYTYYRHKSLALHTHEKKAKASKKWNQALDALCLVAKESAFIHAADTLVFEGDCLREEGHQATLPQALWSYTKAAELFSPVAAFNATDAFRLGDIYRKAHNLPAAYANFERAHKRGHAGAEDAMERVLTRMTPAQQEAYQPKEKSPELPPEICQQIISYGSPGTLANWELVSKAMSSLARTNPLWEPYVQRSNITKVPGVPFKPLVEANWHFVEGVIAHLNNDWYKANEHLFNAARNGNGRAFKLLKDSKFHLYIHRDDCEMTFIEHSWRDDHPDFVFEKYSTLRQNGRFQKVADEYLQQKIKEDDPHPDAVSLWVEINKSPPEGAREFMERLALKGHPSGIRYRANEYLYGVGKFPVNFEERRKFLHEWAQRGNVTALQMMTEPPFCFPNGVILPPHLWNEVHTLIRKVKREGHLAGLDFKLRGLLEGKYNFKKNLPKAIKLMRRHQYVPEGINFKTVQNRTQREIELWGRFKGEQLD